VEISPFTVCNAGLVSAKGAILSSPTRFGIFKLNPIATPVYLQKIFV